ncbi:MAG: endonuclease/exonuclease/phosphatase family protein [Verrucomicrobiia bacterium]
MRLSQLLRLLLLATLSLLGAGTLPAQQPTTLQAVTWNIEWFPGKSRNADPATREAHAQLVQTELKKIDPDLFLAQEIADWQSFAELCAAVPGLRPVALSAFSNEETGEYWPQQLGIASKLPVEAAWSEPWKEGDPTPRRGFTVAALRLPQSDRLLLVYNLHLKSNRSNSDEEAQLNFRTRNESIRQLLAHIHATETVLFRNRVAAVLIGGDFNTNHDGQFADQVIPLLLDAGFHHTWANVPRNQRLTWRGSDRFEPTTFDHFFTKGLAKVKAQLLTVPDATSDHWPVQIRFPLPQP